MRPTHPSALIRNPPCNPLAEDKADNESDDLREKAANAALNDGDGHAIAEAQQGHDAAPVDVAVAEQSATTPTNSSVYTVTQMFQT